MGGKVGAGSGLGPMEGLAGPAGHPLEMSQARTAVSLWPLREHRAS